METGRKKSVIVVDATLPLGAQVNAAAILAATLGERVEGLIGPDVRDASGGTHLGLIQVPLPILAGPSEKIAEIRTAAMVAEEELVLADFSEPAQAARTYEDYAGTLAALPAEDIRYLGVALYGDAKKVSRLTGNLSLLR